MTQLGRQLEASIKYLAERKRQEAKGTAMPSETDLPKERAPRNPKARSLWFRSRRKLILEALRGMGKSERRDVLRRIDLEFCIECGVRLYDADLCPNCEVDDA